MQPAHVHSQEEPRNHFNEKIRQLVKRALEPKLLLWRQMARLNKHIINGGIHHSVTLRSEIGHVRVLAALSLYINANIRITAMPRKRFTFHFSLHSDAAISHAVVVQMFLSVDLDWEKILGYQNILLRKITDTLYESYRDLHDLHTFPTEMNSDRRAIVEYSCFEMVVKDSQMQLTS